MTTFNDLPVELTSFLERESWVRIAASALYIDRIASPATPDPFIQLLLTGECFRPLYEYERALIQFKLAYPAAFK